MNKKIKFAIVGLGFIGRRHADLIKGNEHFELVAVADSDKKLEKEVVEQYGVKFFDSLDEMLESDILIDVVNICTPNGLHSQQAIKVLERKHHVVLEKPMGLHKKECEEVIFKALQVSRFVFCVMQNRYSPPAVWLKSLIEENKLGKIFLVQINCYWNRDERYYKKNHWKGTLALDGGPLFTQFSHFIDMMYWLFGDIKNIQAHFENFNHHDNTEFFDDSGFVSFNFVKGGIGSFNYSTSVYDKNLESSMTIISEKGSVKIGGQYMDKVEVCNIQNYKMPQLASANPPNDYGTYKGSASNHNFIFENVLETLSDKTTMTTNAMEGMKVVEIIERIYEQRK